jgi:hypothetical protein
MAGKIYAAFPAPPDDYPHKERINPNVIVGHFVYHALKRRFKDRVEYIHWGARPKYHEQDIVVGLLGGQSMNERARSVTISNDNFEVDKWKHGRFRKYGLNLETDHTAWINGGIKGRLACVWMTNDVALKKWNTDHPDVKEKKDWLLSTVGSMRLMQHPIDKNFMCGKYDPNRRFDHLRMLIYHDGWRKNAQQLIDLLKYCGMKERVNFDVTSWVDKTDPGKVDQILKHYAYLGHISVSEGFPYMANEFLCQGLLLYGHEEWWNGYGYQGLRWTYDPARTAHNVESLKVILGDAYKDQYYHIRQDVWNKHINRTDNTWECFTKAVVEEVEKHA